MADSMTSAEGSPLDFRYNLLSTLWKVMLGLVLVVALFSFVGALGWSWYAMLGVWFVQSLLTSYMLRPNRYRLSAWIFVILTALGVCIPLYAYAAGLDPQPASDVLLQGLPFIFIIVVFIAGILLPPWSTLILLGIEVLIVALPFLYGVSVSSIHWIAVLFTGMSVATAWAASGPLFETADWAMASYHQAEERAEELLRSRDELQKALAIRDTLNAQLRQANEEMRRRSAQLQAAAEVSQALASASDLNDALPRVVQVLHDRFGTYAALYFADEDRRELALRAVSGATVSHLTEGYRLPIDETTAVGWCVIHAVPRTFADVRREGTLVDHLLPDTRSELAVPLVARGDVIGAVDMQSSAVGAFGEQEAILLKTIADLIANTISNVRSLAEARRALLELSKVQRRYVREAWEEYTSQLEATGYRWMEGEVSALGHRPLPEVARVASVGRTIAEPDKGLVTPITLRGEVIGALGVHDPSRTYRWTEEEIALVESVAGQMAMAVDNARLFEEAQARLAEIMALHRRYLREAWEEFLPTLPRDEFTFAQPGLSAEMALPPEVEKVLRENKILAMNRSTDGQRESLLIAPITLRDEVIGALGLQEEGMTREWSEDDLALIQAVTEQMAIAIENVRLFEETERRAIELEQVAEKLRETDRFRAQFLANMSHELRTPLNSIIGFSRVILKGIDGPLTDMQRMDLEAIYNNGQHLLNLINDILDMSKIEAGKMELVIENVDLGVLIKGVMSTSKALVKEKPIELRAEVDPDLPIIRADSTRVRQVILNLMSNAAKFTEEGSITLRAWHDDEMVYISVTDTGEGIPEEKMPLLFEEFRQIDYSSTRRAGGTGLGLPISRYFVEMHGGQIWVESEVGVGSTFTFSLPIEGPVERVEELADFERDEDKKLLLVVEQNEQEFAAYKVLEKGEYQLVALYDPQEAVRWARYLKPWAIIVDVQAGEGEGWKALDSLRSSRATREVPVIVCAALEEGGGQAISMGATAYLPKPLSIRDLVAALNRLER